MNDGINYKIIKNTRMNKWMKGLSEMRERINEYKNEQMKKWMNTRKINKLNDERLFKYKNKTFTSNERMSQRFLL